MLCLLQRSALVSPCVNLLAVLCCLSHVYTSASSVTSLQRVLTEGRIGMDGFFMEENSVWHPTVSSANQFMIKFSPHIVMCRVFARTFMRTAEFSFTDNFFVYPTLIPESRLCRQGKLLEICLIVASFIAGFSFGKRSPIFFTGQTQKVYNGAYGVYFAEHEYDVRFFSGSR